MIKEMEEEEKVDHLSQFDQLLFQRITGCLSVLGDGGKLNPILTAPIPIQSTMDRIHITERFSWPGRTIKGCAKYVGVIRRFEGNDVVIPSGTLVQDLPLRHRF